MGRMAANWERPAGECLEARVRAVIRRTRQQTDEKYLARVRCEAWEVVLPELVFQPAESVGANSFAHRHSSGE